MRSGCSTAIAADSRIRWWRAVIREGVNVLDAAGLHERAAMLLADDGVENERVAEHLHVRDTAWRRHCG